MNDVLVIGSGAGGGSVALALARAGVDVLVLERGPRHDRESYSRDEVAMGRRDFFAPSPYTDPHALLKHGEERSVPSDMGWTACCVGGGTVIMASYLFRLHPDDFRMKSHLGPYESIADWPYSYDELEPYYSQAEWELGVCGAAGTNPFEGPRSRPYPMPPLRANRLAEAFDEACGRLGLNAFPTPRGINSQPYEGRPACAYCQTCAGWGCAVGAKASSQETLLAKAEQTGHCEVRPRSMAREITVDERGRATGCIYFDENGAEHRVSAKVVCVCCSAVESSRLLLLSKSALFPDGLANGHGQVGRNLQFHSYSGGMGHFRLDRHSAEMLGDPTPFLGRSVMDHYFLPKGVADLPKGGLFRFGIDPISPIGIAQRVAEEGPERSWGEALMSQLKGYVERQRIVDFEVFHDFIANDRTFVTLDPEHTDRWGLPIALLHVDNIEHHKVAGRWLLDRCTEILSEMGVDELTSLTVGEPAGILVHGTCRAGHDPTDSVVNGHCQAHEVPNLYVVDGSFMPTSGGAPPTLTIVANGFRTAEAMTSRARAGALES